MAEFKSYVKVDVALLAELFVLMSLMVSVDVKQYWTVLRHWSQFVPNMSTDIRGHEALLHLAFFFSFFLFLFQSSGAVWMSRWPSWTTCEDLTTKGGGGGGGGRAGIVSGSLRLTQTRSRCCIHILHRGNSIRGVCRNWAHVCRFSWGQSLFLPIKSFQSVQSSLQNKTKNKTKRERVNKTGLNPCSEHSRG